jgi:hypothetical protein
MMPQAMTQDKARIGDQLEGLWAEVVTAAQAGTGVHEIEGKLLRGVLKLGYELLGCFFRLVGPGDVGPQTTLSDGRVVKRLKAEHTRPYQSVLGDFELARWVYGTREEQRIEYVPVDERLQLPESSFSYLLQDWAQELVTALPHHSVAQILKKILGISVSVSALERMNGAMAETVEPYWEMMPPVPAPDGQFLVASADGKGVPIRKPPTTAPLPIYDPQAGPKPDRKKMAIVGAVYDAQPYVRTPEQVWRALFQMPAPAANDDTLAPRPSPIAKAVRASLTVDGADGVPINARETIFTWLGEPIQHRDPPGNKRVVALMDGQGCLWDDAQAIRAHRDNGVEVLDLLHATSHLWSLVPVFHDPSIQLNAMKCYTRLLLHGGVKHLVVWFRYRAEESALTSAERQRVNTVCNYFETHQHRMRYDEYLAAGYPIASGVIEGACRHVVKDRLERTGMHWTIPGAQAMLKLRCVAINEQWDEFTQFRIQRETERLYPERKAHETLEWPWPQAA